MGNFTVNVHQVGFIPLYLPFYLAIAEVAKELGWSVKYHVGVSDEDNIKRACRFKLEDKDNLHLVLTALHNLKVLNEKDEETSEAGMCKDCHHKNKKEEQKCRGIFKDVEWFFPWIFVVKLPVYVFLKGDLKSSDELKQKVNRVGIRRQLDWDDIKELLRKEVKKIFIYPEGATINDAVLNHVYGDLEKIKKNNDKKFMIIDGKEIEIEEINFDIERSEKSSKIDKEEEPVLIFTLNPHLYENDQRYKLIMKPPHHFFPFTGIAIPVVKEMGVTINEIKFLYHLEEKYIDIMTTIQENTSAFFKKKDENRYTDLQNKLNKIFPEKYPFYEKGNYGEGKLREIDKEKLKDFWNQFIDLYGDDIFREHTENVINDYLKEKTNTTVVLFDPEIYRARAKDAAAYIFARNLSHVYGSNVIPYVVEQIQYGDEKTKEKFDNLRECNIEFKRLQRLQEKLRDLLEFLQERMDYIATIISDENISPYSFIGFDISELKTIFQARYNKNPFNYLFTSINKYLDDEIYISQSIDDYSSMTAVPPVLYTQAFYSIFENILRNAAKYGKSEEGLDFGIDIKKEERFIKVTIIDKNVTDRNIEDLSENELKELEKEVDKIAKELNTRFKRAIVNPYMEISYESWGLKEMKISAAFLRGIPLDEIDLDDEFTEKEGSNPPIISVECVKVKEKVNGTSKELPALGFTFYLYPFKEIHKIEISELASPEKDIPCEFMIIKGSLDKELENVLEERKYTRILLEKNPVKNEERDYKEKWIRKIINGDYELVGPYLIHDSNSYIKFYNEVSEKLENGEINENKIIVAYVRHLRDIGNFGEFLKKIKRVSPYSYVQALKGGGFINSLVMKTEYDEFIKYKLIEAALLRILIIDERVQEKVKEKYTEGESANIYVPMKTPLIEAVRSEAIFKKLKEELKEIRERYNPHIVVVHVSLLEQADTHLGDERFKREILEELFKNSDIILTTGRGKITSKYRDIYGDAVPISHILKAVEGFTINKYILSNTLIGFNRNILINKYRQRVGRNEQGQ